VEGWSYTQAEPEAMLEDGQGMRQKGELVETA
jgi:hypothetical protein